MNLTKYKRSEWIGMRVYVMGRNQRIYDSFGFTGKIIDHSLNRRKIENPRVLVMPENAGPHVKPKWIDPDQVEVLEA